MTDAQTPGPDDPGRSRIRFGQPSPGAPGVSFGPAGALVGMALVVAVLGGLLWAAASGQPASAARPSLFGGSLVLEDSRPLTVINVATAQVTVRLQGVNGQVGANSYGDVQSVPVSDGTVLVNRKDGAFNFLERDDYVTDPHGTGVGLGTLTGLTGAEGLGAGSDAYILRSAPKSTVSLVGRPTVAAAAKAPGTSVTPLGFASLDGTVSLQAGGAAVSGRGLWALVATAKGCRADYLQPSATGQESLDVTTRDKPAGNCGADAVESAAGMTGIASPGSVRLFPAAAGSRPSTVAVPASRSADRILAVTGAGPDLWFLAHEKSGWSLFGVDRSGRPSGPYRLSGFSAASQPVTPVYSRGFLYTLDQTVSPQPTLWTIDPANGHMAPVRGASVYPLRSSSEKDSFQGAEVLADGPRVVFNNPQSLEAVVVFTDGSRPPAVVDKSLAVAVSTTGPADLNVTSPTTTPAGSNSKGSQKPGQPPTSQPVPVSQPVSQQVTCANTTQKPYAPQVTAITPSSGTALIAWSYELLDQTDCEPSSWSVQVTALSGSHQPANPTQVVYGQNQYLFTGLRPATRYSVVVTAYINKQSTPSTPATFTTAARGPDAPLSVSTASDGQGNWVVSWKPCTEAQNPNCVVPADQWSVIGSGCGGSYVGTPPTVQVAGGTDSVTINADNLGLLGESLSFSVQGVLASGLTGNPTGDGACTQAWRPPNAAALSLSGSGAATGSTITATLQVSVTGNPVEAFGTQPSETDFVYSIDGRTVGPTNQPKVTVSGLPAGQQFTPSVSIYPAGHPDAAVTVTGSSFSQTLPWPADLQGGTRVIPTVGSDPNTGSISVVFPPDLPAGPLKASGALLSCGSTAISETDATVSGGRIGYPMDLVNSGGDCSLSLTLRDTASPDPYGGPSPQITARFAIGTQPQYSFAVSYSQTCVVVLCQNHVVVSATGSGPMSAGGDWAVSSHSNLDHGPAQFCATNQGLSGPDFPYTFDLPSQCPPKTPVDVTVSYRYLGQDISVDAGTVSAAPPPTTTTSAPPSTTTTTTLPTVTTTPPCPTTTTAKATTTTTKATGSTTT
ncbi:MAG TPA: fibronectin type III domain-containing protein, partial [Acidimicrobiales bacterium]|nr:fibronectin type III domain-containing protein [Acidimicrobiales bacterium]